MLPIKCQGIQYMVSLDNLDLTFLSQYVEQSVIDHRPLWSKPTLDGESMLCEVELVSEKNNQESSYIESSENVICHICNIDVPKIFFQQHTKSEMHENYMKLTQMILIKMSKQIAINIENTDTKNQHDKFYCGTCSKVVLITNKRKHIRSNYHMKCKENEKQINDFLKIYTSHQESACETDVLGDANKIKNDDTINSNKSYVESEYDTASDTDLSQDSNEISNRKEINNSEKIGQKEAKVISKNTATIETSTSFKNPIYTKEKKDINPSLKLNLDAPLCVKTPNGFIDIKTKNYHGYIVLESHLFCQLCDKWLVNSQEHNTNEEHIRHIMQPINDDFCRAVINKNKNHCLLCNKIISADSHSHHVDVHGNHIENVSNDLKNKVDVKKNVDDKVETGKTYCDICNRLIHTNNFLAHTKGKSHKELKEKKEKANIPVKTKIMVNTATSQKVQTKEEYCNICDVSVPFGGKEVHEAGKPHKQRMLKAITSFNKLANILVAKSEKSFTTSKTANTTPLPNKTGEGMANQDKYEYKKYMNKLSATEMKCLICDVKVPNLIGNISEHIKGHNHKNNISVILNVNRMKRINEHLYNCQLCNIDVKDLIQHINENLSHIKKRLLSDEINKTKLKEYVYDNPTNVSPLAVAYRDVYKDLLSQNRLVENGGSFFCWVCCKRLKRLSEIDHIFGEQHKSLHTASV